MLQLILSDTGNLGLLVQNGGLNMVRRPITVTIWAIEVHYFIWTSFVTSYRHFNTPVEGPLSGYGVTNKTADRKCQIILVRENNVPVYVVYCKTNDIRSLSFNFVTCLHELHNMYTFTK